MTESHVCHIFWWIQTGTFCARAGATGTNDENVFPSGAGEMRPRLRHRPCSDTQEANPEVPEHYRATDVRHPQTLTLSVADLVG